MKALLILLFITVFFGGFCGLGEQVKYSDKLLKATKQRVK